MTDKNAKKQKELEAEKAARKTPQTLDAFDIIDKLEEQKPEPKIEPKPEPEPKIEPKPEQKQPEPEPIAKKADDFTNIYGYARPQPEPRRRFDYEPRKREPDRPRFEPIRESEKIEPEREEPIFRDPWQEITDSMEKWKKADSEVEKNIIKTGILQNIEKYEKSGVPPHRQMSLDSYVRALNYDSIAAEAEELRKIREQELERKRREAAELEKKYEDERGKNVKQEADARQTTLRKKKKDELEMGR